MKEKKQAPAACDQEGWSKERRFQRSECDIDSKYYFHGKWHNGKTITISAGGAYLACRAPRIKANDLIDLFFYFDGLTVPTISRVVWVNPMRMKNGEGFTYPPGFAVEFEKISGELRAELDQFVKKSLRTLKALVYELRLPEIDHDKITHMFLSLRPGDSTRLSHIRKVVRHDFRHFRLRKLDTAK
jgi:hypothetical protein